jgi:transposase
MPSLRKEHSNEFRETIIKRSQNGDSERESAEKMLCSRNTIHSIIVKYKKTRCIGNIIGRGRKRITTIRIDKVIQRKIKVDRWKSASSVKHEIEKKSGGSNIKANSSSSCS